MVAKEKGAISATYCVASNSYMTNCRNQTDMPGINMHYSLKEQTFLQKITRFVRIHRKYLPPVKKLALCCAYFFDVVGSEFS